MKQDKEFERLGKILNPDNTEFKDAYHTPDYALETLINGNISECINHLRELIGTGIIGMKVAHEQLSKIEKQVPERYEYVKNQVFNYFR